MRHDDRDDSTHTAVVMILIAVALAAVEAVLRWLYLVW